MKKVLIVGGVAGGASTATRLRRLDENLEIIIFEKGEYVSFANCGLPYYIGDIIQNRESLLVQTPESLKARFNLDVRVNSEVVGVNGKDKKVKVKTKNGEEYEEIFDFLVLAPGAKPIFPAIKGIENKKIFTLRNINDMDKIKSEIKNNAIKKAVVVGGGYVGIETAENLKHLGIDTTLVEAASHILAPFDSEISNILEYELVNNGIELMTSEKVVEFQENGNEIIIKLESGKSVTTDMVILSIGVSPDTKFLEGSGINLGERGHILVNENLETNIDGVYALGDSILVKNYITNQNVGIPLAGPANRQGRIVAGNIVGRNEKYKGSLGTAIIKIFELTGASTGLNERSLKQLNITYEKIYLHPNNHAAYYPGASPISIKALYNKENKQILGAQAVGISGVDKFIDVIATSIKFKATIDDLAELELAYAPPFLSAKSPANMVGFIGQNIEDDLLEQVFMEDLKKYDEKKTIILDIREELELIGGKFDNSINIPLSELRKRYTELPKNKEIWTYCAVGLRGYIATRFLSQKGYRVKNLAGGIKSEEKVIVNTQKESSLTKEGNSNIEKEEDYLDLSGLSCPGPLVKIKEKIDKLGENEKLKVKVSDLGFYNDIQAWSKVTKNSLLSLDKKDGLTYATLQKGQTSKVIEKNQENVIIEDNSNMTMVVFSGDLDKAIAAFIIANGALTMGKKVTMFFTFWGLSILKKKNLAKKSFIEKMFAMMLPKNSQDLPVSKMNFFGIGAKMIRSVMKKKNIMSLEELIKKAIDSGVNITACTMSMDVMGISEEELIDGINYGGVGQYLGEAEKSNNNLFI
ncbi:CoA-disulfide reductase [Fusobacterium polymorphum]|uniref:Pyridine nucleotide-disulfide oxidoreductase n=1 Tax=Fusobacterium nucleatum subsp. polymorphum TaxID=76857 RepID=A0AAC8WG82_FUSNP|nr:CoA-disulfide reductase [Fusobacterium polymorphum]ALM94638.1 pyridine nucleotide-disulfide oxidoreductase [Fusobacterium polymorphum]WRL74066.1 CoA-disulfide reductase [Fusobacterium polymorphum]